MPDYRPTPWGDLLRAYRERVGWSQAALARQAGIHSSYVSILESGASSERYRPARPSIETASALSNALQLEDADRETFLIACGHMVSNGHLGLFEQALVRASQEPLKRAVLESLLVTWGDYGYSNGGHGGRDGLGNGVARVGRTPDTSAG